MHLQQALQLIQNNNVTSLDLRYSHIGIYGVKALAAALLTNTTITSLDLSGNHIGAEGAVALAKALLTNPTITSLYLAYNHIGDDGAVDLAKALLTNTTITSLDLSGNQIGEDGAVALAEVLRTNPTITSLDLRYNQIGDDGAVALAEALRTNPTITSLYLSGNQIGNHGAKALAEALLTNKYITVLNLSYNKIGDDGATALTAALLTNKYITSLNLYSNEIGDDGAVALAAALRTKNTIISLNLSFNQIGAQGMIALLDMLRNNPLTDLSLDKLEKVAKLIIETNKTNYFNQQQADVALVQLAQHHGTEMMPVIKYLIETADEKFPFSVNAKHQGHTIGSFYTHDPVMLAWLFEHGYIPTPPTPPVDQWQNIVDDTQSVHNSVVVRTTNSYLKTLFKLVKADDAILDQKALEFIASITQMREMISNDGAKNYINFTLLNLSTEQQNDLFEKTNYLKIEYQQNKQATIIKLLDKVLEVLKNQYMAGSYDHYKYYYDNYAPEQFIQIPRLIGAIKLLIDNTSPSKEEIKQLYCSSLAKYMAIDDIALLTKKDAILQILKQANLKLGGTIEELANLVQLTTKDLTEDSKCHGLINSLTQQQIEDLSYKLNGIPAQTLWQSNKMADLVMKLYIAATTYGDNSSACTQGTLSQIAHTLPFIKEQFMQDADLAEQLIQNKYLVDTNIKEWADVVALQLIEICQEKGLNKALFELMTTINPKEIDQARSNITLEQQKALAEINQLFKAYIKDYLADYNLPMPSLGEYKLILEILSQHSAIAPFCQNQYNSSLTITPKEIEEATTILQKHTKDLKELARKKAELEKAKMQQNPWKLEQYESDDEHQVAGNNFKPILGDDVESIGDHHEGLDV
jgi:Ran GTPase-activating protein (RanGAP) involved in mRNA processing and transport